MGMHPLPIACFSALFWIGTSLGPEDLPPSQEDIKAWRVHWDERRLTERKFWRHDTSQEPPYRPPVNWEYNTTSVPVEGKINVHIVPHTHDDTGWQVTVDQYFYQNVYYILDTVVRALAEDPNRRFMYVEIGFFARWYDTQPQRIKNLTKKLVSNRQLEFINGGWCMHDEAAPYYVEMVDQTTRGHQFLVKEFGKVANPKGTWQIDPFGHSNTQAWLLSAEAGMGSLFWGRMDYLDAEKRIKNSGLEWIWRGSQSLGKSADTFIGELFGTNGNLGYGCPMGFDGTSQQIQDDPTRHDYNVDEQIERFIGFVKNQSASTKTNHIMWACGSDFNYQNAAHWYHNLDKLIHYANLNGTVNVLYSTPTFYVEQKNKAKASWEVRQDDIFPLADDAHHYWTGYFTSRPALKRQVRFSSNLLNAARQLEAIVGISAKELNRPTTRPAPPVGDGWTDSLEGTIGVSTHHDGMSGTERQDVADDYAQRIAESQVEVEDGIAASLNKLLKHTAVNASFSHCGCAQMNTCLNISLCDFTAKAAQGFSVMAWSPLGQPSTQIIRVPVTGTDWKVTDMSTGDDVPMSVFELDNRTLSLPLMYINHFGLSEAEERAKEAEYANSATHQMHFAAKLPSVGYNTFLVSKASETDDAAGSNPTTTKTEVPLEIGDPIVVSNGVYEFTINSTLGGVGTLRNLKSGISSDLSISWGWYNSSTGGCTREIPGPPATEAQCNGQRSGAYIFRPNSSQLFYPGVASDSPIAVYESDLVTEVHQQFSDWASHVIRMYKNAPYVEIEWTAGPIPMNTDWIPGEGELGKEVVMKYVSSLDSKNLFYTDSNGREMVKRILDGRGPSYPQPLNISEPVAGNYYPVNAMIAIEDPSLNAELVVITDAALGGTSLAPGEIELMVHRRVLEDDNRGVQEPLNETMCGCNDINAPPGKMGEFGHLGDGGCECTGLTIRGRHWVVLDTIENANLLRRQLDNLLNFPATLAFSEPNVAKTAQNPKQEYLAEPLPENVKLMTLCSNYKTATSGKTLLRLAHLYSVGEHPTLSVPAKVSLSQIFAAQDLKIATVEETALTGNEALKKMDDEKLIWDTFEPWNYTNPTPYDKRIYMDKNYIVEIRPMELRTFWVTFA
ncbi:hypothetical protein AAMO2058_000306400 [Amorphochlora amoebiformis]